MEHGFSWLQQLKRTYIGNATATRDMRVQLRGSRAAIMFTVYLAIMGFVLLMVYSSSIGDGMGRSLATAQSMLQNFYYQTLTALGVVITLAAPSMGAFAIVTEKQRRSLDLVFSAPTEPKYYLVGKLISSFRYVWLLLVLSLPFCAISVTLGGTTWGQLFITFLLFSFYGLVCVSIGLLMSTLCSKVLPAIIWTYLAVGCYWVAIGGSVGISAAVSGPFFKVNPFSSLCPVAFPFVADQTWPIFGYEVPTWIFSVVLHLLVVKLIILAAGSLLAPGSSREIRSLRIHGIVYSAALSFLTSSSIEPYFYQYSTASSGGTGFEEHATLVHHLYHGRVIFGLLFLIGLIVVPYLASFGFNDLRRHRPNGMFNPREVLSGRPSGHLPFLILLAGINILAYVIGSAYGHTPGLSAATAGRIYVPIYQSMDFWMYILVVLNLWYLAFLLGFYSCGKAPVLSRGRTIALFFFILGIVLPTALFSIVAPEEIQTATGVWILNPTAAIFSGDRAAGIAVSQGVALTCINVILTALTLPRVSKQSAIDLEQRLELAHDRN